MTKQERIKEIAKILHSTHAESVICIGKDCNFCKHAGLKIFDDYTCIDLDLAEALHNEGYRKVDEVRKETAREIFQRVINICRKEEDFQDGTVNTQLKPLYFGIMNGCAFVRGEVKELAKQYGVEVEE